MDNSSLKKDAIEHIEGVPAQTTAQRRGYEASTPGEKALDKSINWKLDCIVIVMLAFDFLVGCNSLAFTQSANVITAARYRQG
jgi:hypothetical protein